MSRDDCTLALQKYIEETGLADSCTNILKITLCNKVIKMLQDGKAKYQVVEMLDRQFRTSGPDARRIYTEVYNVIKPIEM